MDITFDNTKTHISLFAPATDKLKCLNDVIDKVYSTKTLDDGFAIKPTNGKVCAPINGEIVNVFQLNMQLVSEMNMKTTTYCIWVLVR